jgi:hypothetical protein
LDKPLVARRNHYVSQCYLKAFATVRRKGAPHVQVFDRMSRKQFGTGTDNVAVEGNFNVVNIEGHPPDVFEKAQADFENGLAPALQRIINTNSFAENEDKTYLLNFICMLALRNPRQRESIRDFHERVSFQMLELTLATKERWESQVQRAKAAGHMEGVADVPYETLKEQFKPGNFRLTLPNERHLQLELQTFDKALPYLFDRHWVLLIAPESSGGFVTSDHPFIIRWTKPELANGIYGAGIGMKSTEIFLPIAPRLAVIGSYELDQDGTLPLWDDRQVAAYNGLTALYASRQVYSRDLHFRYLLDKDEGPRKASKLIDDKRFTATKEELVGRISEA